MDCNKSQLCIVCCSMFTITDHDQVEYVANINKVAEDIKSYIQVDVFWKQVNFCEELKQVETKFGLSICPICLSDLNKLIKTNETMSLLENQVVKLQQQILKGLRDIEECQQLLKYHQDKIRLTVDKSDVSCFEKRCPPELHVNQISGKDENPNKFALKLRELIIQDTLIFKKRKLQGNLSISQTEENKTQLFDKVKEEPNFDDFDDRSDSNSFIEPFEQEPIKTDPHQITNQKNKKPRIKSDGLRKTSSMTLRTRVAKKPNSQIQQPIITLPPSKKTKTFSPKLKTLPKKASKKTQPPYNTGTVYSCQLCTYKTRRIPSFEQHLKEHEIILPPQSLQKCLHCPSQFSTNQYLEFHQKLHDDYHNHSITTPTMRCDICVKFFPILYLPSHLKSHFDHLSTQPPNLIFCQNCSFVCTTSQAYMNHHRTHYPSDKATFNCSICSEIFHNPKLLVRHYPLVHEGFKETWSCDIPNCSETFPCKDTFLEHKRSMHKFKAKSIPCRDPNCSKKFSSIKSMEVHYCVHSGEKPFPCEICGERFISRDDLMSHQRRLHGAAKLKCEICGKEFIRPRTLKSHMAFHENREVGCEICGMTFGNKNRLKKHLLTHSEEMRWTCEKCGKGFKSKDGWRDHMAAHEDKKNLKCEYCGKGFVRKSNLREHLRVHTGERPYICDVCGKDFNQASALRIHKRTQHQ